MWSKRPTLYVCPLMHRVLALVIADQNTITATATLSACDEQTQPSNAWAPDRNLSPVKVQANPSACGLQDDPPRRPLCVP